MVAILWHMKASRYGISLHPSSPPLSSVLFIYILQASGIRAPPSRCRKIKT